MPDVPPQMEETVVADQGGLHLNEHWEDNMLVFNIGPSRPKDPPRLSGRRFAARNPRHDPYCWWAWDSNRGPLVTPNVTATQVHELVEAATACNTSRPERPVEIFDALPRPWHVPAKEGDWWWPRLRRCPGESTVTGECFAFPPHAVRFWQSKLAINCRYRPGQQSIPWTKDPVQKLSRVTEKTPRTTRMASGRRWRRFESCRGRHDRASADSPGGHARAGAHLRGGAP